MGAVVQFPATDANRPELLLDDLAGIGDSILLTAVLESCAEGLAIVEGARVLRANYAFARIFGYFDTSEIITKSLAEFIPESSFLFSPNPELATSTESPVATQCTGLRLDGAEIEILAASAIFHTGQRELQVINLSEMEKQDQEPRNIAGKGTAPQEIDAGNLAARNLVPESSQRAIRGQQPVESQRFELMGRLVGGVAHDFNNLLTGILLYCDLLTRGLDAQSPLRNYVQEIRKAGGHSSALIQQLLSATHTQGEDALPHSWSDVIAGMQNFLARMLGESIELVTEMDPGVALVSLSQTSMRQIALNLLLNARDAMPAGGRIVLAVRNCADCVDTPAELLHGYVEFSVSDRGCGMDADTRDHLFDAFFTTKGPGHGFGLGLATVQRIVTEARGSLEVQSEPVQGTRVFVRLPQALPEPQGLLERLQKNQQPGPEIQKSETQLRA